ncbi:hypothetical protein STRMA_0435 [Streptococcus macacae NCTC 11558]|uniref:Uncharacterized protein n=1 Tax=Streptococcus macacae NCTC 11558 TaxID=764298 RepID=G5JZ18_9STRE|nr:hypothetical protein STRMA_0435 [Streptococcus macacae NCTC 11558]
MFDVLDESVAGFYFLILCENLFKLGQHQACSTLALPAVSFLVCFLLSMK